MGRYVLPQSAGPAVAALPIYRPLAPAAAPDPSSVKTRGRRRARRNRRGCARSRLDASRGAKVCSSGGYSSRGPGRLHADRPGRKPGTLATAQTAARDGSPGSCKGGSVRPPHAAADPDRTLVNCRAMFAAAWRTADAQIWRANLAARRAGRLFFRVSSAPRLLRVGVHRCGLDTGRASRGFRVRRGADNGRG
jgi:hypothetical protein